MKAKDWQKATTLVWETAMADTSELSSFSLSELPVDQSDTQTICSLIYKYTSLCAIR